MSTVERNDPSNEDVTTPERAMRVVAEILEQGGEHALRLNDISRRSRVSVGSIYHHFGSREGLVDATREWLFAQSVPGSTQSIVEDVLTASSPKEFLERFGRAIDESGSEEQARSRRRRLLVLGAAVGRAGHYPGVVEAQTAYLDLYEQVVVELQRRGWLSHDIDSRSLALFLHALSLGRVFGEFDAAPFNEEEWRKLLLRTLECLMQEQ